MNVNNFGPKSAMGAKNLQGLQNLRKTDKSGLVGNAQEATAADNRPEGDTKVDKTVIVTWKDPNGGSGSDNISDIVYDGELNGVVVNKYPDGTVYVEVDEHLHNHLATIASDQNN